MMGHSASHRLELLGALALATTYGCGSGDTDAPAGAGSAGTVDGGGDASSTNGSVRGDAGSGDATSDTTMGDGDAEAEAGSSCGDGVVDPGEQCDDGNTTNLDGCDATCRYEAVARMTRAAFSGLEAPAGCAPRTNVIGRTVFGSAVWGSALDDLNRQLSDSINAGITNVLVQVFGANEQGALDGVSGTGLSVGIFSGVPDPRKGVWPGTSADDQPVDWWFKATQGVDASGRPSSIMTGGAVSTREVAAGPGTGTLLLDIAGATETFTLTDAHVFGVVDDVTSPPAAPPNAEQLAAGFTTAETFTATGDGTQGVCGNVTVASLAASPLPDAEGGGGIFSALTDLCGYTACQPGESPTTSSCSSLLDVFVGGCNVGPDLWLVPPTPPDVDNGGPELVPDPTTRKVPSAQTDGNRDGYSAYMTFAAKRAHLTNNL